MSIEAPEVRSDIPSLVQIEEVKVFLNELNDIRSKLEVKKVASRNIIELKMKELHNLIDKWEVRFLDTMTETIDEKIESLAKQEEKLRGVLGWIEEEAKTKKLNGIFPIDKSESQGSCANEEDTEDRFQNLDDNALADEEEEERPEDELAKNNYKIWKSLKFPLSPVGTTMKEVSSESWEEFGQLLEESRKSLKRSLLFVGGIIRAYMRRGHKKDEWVAMIRRLEARVENNMNIDSTSDAGIVPSPPVYLPREASVFTNIWLTINDIYKYRNEMSVKDTLTNQFGYVCLHYPTKVSFYLLQLIVCLVCYKNFPLTDFIFNQCREKIYFAIQVYFLTSSISQTGPPKWQKRCLKVLKTIIQYIPVIDLPQIPPSLYTKQKYSDSIVSGSDERSSDRDMKAPHRTTENNQENISSTQNRNGIKNEGSALKMNCDNGSIDSHKNGSGIHDPGNSHCLSMDKGLMLNSPDTSNFQSAISNLSMENSRVSTEKISPSVLTKSKEGASNQAISENTNKIDNSTSYSTKKNMCLLDSEEDAEEELRRLTTITKAPQVVRVEKNLEVPVGKEYFFAQIKFARKLVSIGRKLGEAYGYPEKYQGILEKELTDLDVYIKSGYSYLPNVKNVRSRVLRFVLSDCHPIPTYGRVLYKMVVEVVDLPVGYSKQMGDEYVKLRHDFSRINSFPDLSLIASNSEKRGSHKERIFLKGSERISKSQKSSNISKHGRITANNAFNNKINHSDNKISINTPKKDVSKDFKSDKDPQISDSTKKDVKNNSFNEISFGESWKEMRKRIKSESPYSSLPHWNLRAYIVKQGDYVLQEQFVMQLIKQFQNIWDMENINLKLFYYDIVALSYQSGLIQVVPNSISLDKLKRLTESNGSGSLSLLEVFKRKWPTPGEFKKAKSNFVSSLAAYSIVCYLLQIKDRHNGNIMLDSEGYLFHLDFGYLLTRTIKFEKAPFKLTDEFIEVMGGDQSKSFKAYCQLCVRGFIAARKHYKKILLLLEMSMNESGAIPCLESKNITANLRKRYHLDWDENKCEDYIMNLILEARDNWRTQIYDTYQRIVNDIY